MVARAYRWSVVAALHRRSGSPHRSLSMGMRELDTRRVAALSWNFDMLMAISIGFRISQPI
jgi:hypothetical protein